MAPETPPADIVFGRVVGRFLLAVGDTSSDVDKVPDFVAATGTVRITPKVKKITSTSPVATVVPKTITCTIAADGTMLGPNGEPGVWLIVGRYDVFYSLTDTPMDYHEIDVTVDNGEATPVQLPTAMPPGGPLLNPSEYAELSARIDALGAVPPGTVADATTSVKGIVQLAGDLGGTAGAPTVPGLAGKMSRNPIVLTTEDINTLLTPGIYFQPDPAMATGARNYQIADATMLWVVGDVTDSNPVIQFMSASKEWAVRTWNGASWTAWSWFSWSTHNHSATGLTGFTEATQDVVGSMIAAAGGSYDDTAGTIVLPAVDSENVALGVKAYEWQTGKQIVDYRGAAATARTVALTDSMLEILTDVTTTGNQTIDFVVDAATSVVGRVVVFHVPAYNFRVKFHANVVVESWPTTDAYQEIWGTLVFDSDNKWHVIAANSRPYLKGDNVDIFGGAEKLTSGAGNLIVGQYAQNETTTGSYNTSVGNSANYSLTTGQYNTAIGVSAGVLWSKPAINNIVAIGRNAAVAVDSGIAIGYNSDVNDTHTSSVALGATTQTNGANQVAIGARDLEIQDATKGVVLKSPNGTRYRVTVSDAGALVVTAA